MSVFWWILIAYLVWATAGIIRVFSLLGRKNYKDNLIDKILITGAMPIAYIMGAIRHFTNYIEWAFGKSPITKYRERNKENEL